MGVYGWQDPSKYPNPSEADGVLCFLGVRGVYDVVTHLDDLINGFDLAWIVAQVIRFASESCRFSADCGWMVL